MTDETPTIDPSDVAFGYAASLHRGEFADAARLMLKATELGTAVGAVPLFGAVVAPAVGMARDLGTVLLNLLVRGWREFCFRIGADPNPHLESLRDSPAVAEALATMTDADPSEMLGMIAQVVPGYRPTAEQLADALFAEYERTRTEYAARR